MASLLLQVSGQDTGPTPGRLADKQPMCSVPECRQTTGGLHHQRSKAQGDTVPSDPFLSWQAANMAAGLLSFCSSLGRTQAPLPATWQTNHLCAQFLSAGRPLAVCTSRDLNLRVIQYLVTLFCPGRRRIWPRGFSPSAALWAGHRPHSRRAGRQTTYVPPLSFLMHMIFLSSMVA